jgi:hypothetical protein
MALPNYNAAVQKAFGPAVAGKPEVRHIQNLIGEVDAAASAPVTEIATLTLKPGGSMDKLRESIAMLRENPSPGCLGIVSGDCAEQPDTLIALLGWESVEVYLPPLFGTSTESCLQAHSAATKVDVVEKIVHVLITHAEIDVKHYSYAKYPA